jgi:hypothetical protein
MDFLRLLFQARAKVRIRVTRRSDITTNPDGIRRGRKRKRSPSLGTRRVRYQEAKAREPLIRRVNKYGRIEFVDWYSVPHRARETRARSGRQSERNVDRKSSPSPPQLSSSRSIGARTRYSLLEGDIRTHSKSNNRHDTGHDIWQPSPSADPDYRRERRTAIEEVEHDFWRTRHLSADPDYRRGRKPATREVDAFSPSDRSPNHGRSPGGQDSSVTRYCSAAPHLPPIYYNRRPVRHDLQSLDPPFLGGVAYEPIGSDVVAEAITSATDF